MEWPPSAFDSRDAPLRICVIGEDPFGDLLDRVVRGENAGGRAIEVERYDEPDDAESCQIAYVAEDVRPERLSRLEGFEEGLVFTVGESDAFLENGGLVRFLIREGNIALAVNEQARERSRLKVSSKLLQLSELRRPEPETGDQEG